MMTNPVWVLLGFAAWTLLTLFTTIGVYRWTRILTGRASIRCSRPRPRPLRRCERYPIAGSPPLE